MRKELLLSLFSLFFFFLISKNQVLASTGISISPPILEIEENSSQEIVVKNNYTYDLELNIEKKVGIVNLETRKIVLSEGDEENLLKSILLDKEKISIKSNSEEKIKISMDSKLPIGKLVLLNFSEKNKSDELEIVSNISAVILNKTTSTQTTSDFKVKPKWGFFNISFGRNYNISTNIKNETDYFMQISSAQINILVNQKKHTSLTLADLLGKRFWPKEEYTYEKSFDLERLFFGFTTFTLEYSVYGINFTKDADIFYIPFEFLLVLTFSSLLILVFLKRKPKSRKKVQEPFVSQSLVLGKIK